MPFSASAFPKIDTSANLPRIEPLANFPKIDHWSNEMAHCLSGRPEVTSPNPWQSVPSGRMSCSPVSPGPLDTDYFTFDNAFARQQTLPEPERPAPYQRRPVSHHPANLNAAWQAQPHRSLPNFHVPPRRYVFETVQCCTTPRLRVIHDCCDKQSIPREIVHERTSLRRNPAPVTEEERTLCRFCLKNGERPEVCISHNLRYEDGRVWCPVLRRYNCPICHSGGGDYAHTVRYCPALRNGGGNGVVILRHD